MSSLTAAVREALVALGDPGKAAEMQRYMRSSMPYHGVRRTACRLALRAVFAAHPLPDRRAWEDAVRALWHGATHREERYAAIDLTGLRPYRAYQDVGTMPLYEELVVEGAWWDYVDEIAIRRVGPILRAHPAEMPALLRRWSAGGDMWKRRTAVICQVGAKHATDRDLLAACIDATIEDRDFFIRKGIGWALRAYGRVAPEWVRAFVAERGERLSPLSRREALKYV